MYTWFRRFVILSLFASGGSLMAQPFWVFKTMDYVQDSATSTAFVGYRFNAHIDVSDTATYVSSALYVEGNFFDFPPVSDTRFAYDSYYYTDLGAFETDFPDGGIFDYVLVPSDLEAPAESGSVVMTGSYPTPVPMFSEGSYAALQSFDPSGDLTLFWSYMNEVSEVDEQAVFFRITRMSDSLTVYDGFLGGINTDSVLLSANTLEPHTAYRATLFFSNRDYTMLDNGGLGVAAHDLATSVEFYTVPEPRIYAALAGLLALGAVWWKRRR